MSGYGEARPIGRMVPRQATSEPRAAAWCNKCGAKLSAYRDQNTSSPDARYCAPCQLTLGLRPTFDPATTSAENARRAATQPFRCKDCDKPLVLGGKPSKTSLCRACLNESIAALIIHCKKCAKPLAGPIRPNASGLCRVCLNAHHAANKPRCGACQAVIGRSTLYRAQREGRMPRCRACSVGHRYPNRAA